MKQKILIIDSEAGLLAMLKALLDQAGYEVLAVQDQVTGLQACRAAWPDLVILSMISPGIGGLALCKGVRDSDPCLPLIVLAGQASENDTVAVLEAGADSCLAGPFKLREFLARVASILRRRRVWAQPAAARLPSACAGEVGVMPNHLPSLSQAKS